MIIFIINFSVFIAGCFVGYAFAVHSMIREFRKIQPKEDLTKEHLKYIQFVPDDVDGDPSINYEHIQKRDI